MCSGINLFQVGLDILPLIIIICYRMRRLWYKILICVVVFTVLVPLGACNYQSVEPQLETPPDASESLSKPPKAEAALTNEGFTVYNNAQPPYYGADPNKPIVFFNDEAAKNPTWHELKRFLILDTTDENAYLPGIRVCAEFAAELHNKAEKAGIRAAWVALEFEDGSEGHALNAFETTDQGLVFIDCTGGIPIIEIPTVSEEIGTIAEETRCFDTHDKKAYIEISKQCGFIGLEVLSSFEYKAYLDYIYKWDRLWERYEVHDIACEEYEIKLETYNQRVEEYELLVGGRTVIEDQSEYDKLRNMYDELKQMRLKLEQERTELNKEAHRINLEIENLGRCRREPLGVVKSVEIYW